MFSPRCRFAAIAHVWHSRATNLYVLAVARGSRRLNESHTPSPGTFVGPAVFDVWGQDVGWFKDGNHVRADVELGNGTTLTSYIRLGSGR